MKVIEILKQLKKLGTAQNRKVYARHGMVGDVFGVSFANLNQLKRKIKVNHELACDLWRSGNADARHLATMIVDVDQITEKQLDRWVQDVRYPGLAGLLAKMIGRTRLAQKKAEQWIQSSRELISCAGWDLVGCLALEENGPTESFFEKRLKEIEKKIYHSPNFTRHAMNGALIAIGLRGAKLEKLARAAAKRIGKIEVDHGETGCKTPDAIAYIEKTKAWRNHKTKKK